ncbi:MAG: alkaline phosphatase D family protein [Sphingomonadaceae bacterium]|nr:alkaline phosphatase D family protein [Sphingomonadaceae bacterium]
MSLVVDRRSLIRAGAFGLGALALPGGRAAVAQIAAARGFTHAVASGEPGADSMLLWARFVGAGADARVQAEIAETPDFRRVVAGGDTITGPWRDWTAKVTVDGLQPARSYFYRFVADGHVSPIGRTRTLPDGRVQRFRTAVFSCSNLPFGWFNAYGHTAARGDVDLGIHLGDYLYEYRQGEYPSAKDAVAARLLEPQGELLHLADYRLRYACYRADPDLQALHARLPFLIQWDDHETANDSWEGGAEHHDASKGNWADRRAAAVQAWREWMPVSDTPWARYDIGDLASLYRTESRLLARSHQLALEPVFQDADPAAALVRFRDGAWRDPARTMFGSDQEHWLASNMADSVRAGRRWQVVGSGTVLGDLQTPPGVADWLPPGAPLSIRARVQASLAAAKAGLPFNLDSWGGYPAARARLLTSAQHAGADLVVISGDSHNAWAFDLKQDGRAAGVEFAGHAVTSPGYESYFPTVPSADVVRALVSANPELRWANTADRGYMTVELSPEGATAEWLFVDTIRDRRPTAARTHRMRTATGRKQLLAV